MSAERPTGAVLVTEMADALEVKPGSSLVLQAATRDGRQNALNLEVAGNINNSNAAEPKKVLYVPLPFAQELREMEGGTEYVISVPDHARIGEVAPENGSGRLLEVRHTGRTALVQPIPYGSTHLRRSTGRPGPFPGIRAIFRTRNRRSGCRARARRVGVEQGAAVRVGGPIRTRPPSHAPRGTQHCSAHNMHGEPAQDLDLALARPEQRGKPT